MFLKHTENDLIIIVVYVDDIIITGTNDAEILELKQHLNSIFSIKDLGKLHYFLGIEVLHLAHGIVLTQRKFSKELLLQSGLDVSKVAKTPLPQKLSLTADTWDFCSDPFLYRQLVGKLNFLTHTRPDLAFAVQTLSQFMQQPRV
ncbi:uncharacterized protein LOC110703102 [Chenopodium quinoa]|uniref:uncharacterized protein LOC110703102 n=1 Tax=Chenopodium quinoa TaxID=63459 RepID=UPI000B787136|nr:uncharacterized protein LOC110703102 [Chenopodium quinoa]